MSDTEAMVVIWDGTKDANGTCPSLCRVTYRDGMTWLGAAHAAAMESAKRLNSTTQQTRYRVSTFPTNCPQTTQA